MSPLKQSHFAVGDSKKVDRPQDHFELSRKRKAIYQHNLCVVDGQIAVEKKLQTQTEDNLPVGKSDNSNASAAAAVPTAAVSPVSKTSSSNESPLLASSVSLAKSGIKLTGTQSASAQKRTPSS
jgi:hypothetical protein